MKDNIGKVRVTMDEIMFLRAKSAFAGNGGEIVQSAEGDKLLDYRGADAVTLNEKLNHLTFRFAAYPIGVLRGIYSYRTVQKRFYFYGNDFGSRSGSEGKIDKVSKTVRYIR
jgi:hypothetical protein